jgi:hypothetical protein
MIYTDGEANTTAQLSGSLLSGLIEGTHNITIVVVDQFVHIAIQTILFNVDTTLPMISIISQTSTMYDQAIVILTYTVSEGTVTIYTNGIANTTAQPSDNLLSGFVDDTHTITIFTVDEAGNIGVAAVIFTIDTTTTTLPTTMTSPPLTKSSIYL